MSLLQLQGLEKSYFGRTLFTNLNLQLDRGDRLALVGENGAGKTTLLRIIEGSEEPDFGTRSLSRQIRIGYLTQHLSEAGEGLVWQSREWEAAKAGLEASAATLERLGEAGSSAPGENERAMASYQQALQQFEALGGYHYEYDLRAALAALGLPEGIADRPLVSCSGGERMRITLAKLLLSRPDVLLLDEPTNHLDWPAMEWLIQYLNSYKGSLVLVSHDRYFLDRVATRCAFLEGGELRLFPGNYSQAREQKDEVDRYLEQRRERLEKEIEHQQQVVQTFRSHRNISGYHSRQKWVRRLEEEHKALTARQQRGPAKMSFHFLPDAPPGDAERLLVEVKDLSFSYDERPLLQNIRLQLRACDKMALLGPNGCGKSTLLHLLRGVLSPDSGLVRFASDLAVAYQEQVVTFEPEGRSCLGVLLDETDLTEGQARNLLARFGFRSVDVFKTTDVLSGGERARLHLCCLLEQRPNLLVLDEPTNHLDMHSREILEQAISDYSGAVLAVSHDRFFIERFATRYALLLDGSLREVDRVNQAVEAMRTRQATSRAETADEKEPKEAVRKNADSAAEAAPGAAVKSATELNPSQLRKAKAACKKRMQDLEAELERLTEEAQALQEQALSSSDPSLYEKLAANVARHEAAEEEYLEACIEWDEQYAE